MKIILFFSSILLCVAQLSAQHTLQRQGHRGTRGLMPENTIPAMYKAIDLDADVLELDVVISKDNQVVVSHDAYMESDFCLKPNGDTISAAEEKSIVLYQMPYSEIKKYDVGSKPHPQFPKQQKFKCYKPLLGELIDSSDAYARKTGKPLPRYNIEIKSDPRTDGRNQPETSAFVDLVMKVIEQKNIKDRMNIQSFDVRPLQVIHKRDSSVTLAFLVMNNKRVDENIRDLGFVPNIYSPYYKMVSRETVEQCHNSGMRIIPWTINTAEEIKATAALGVDGIITDYPDLFNL